jgi:CRISPR-associated protein Csc3
MAVMNYSQELVDRYTAFYLPKKKKGTYSSTGTVKPLKIAAKILLHGDNLTMSKDELKNSIAAECSKLMNQCRGNRAEGFCVSSGATEREAIAEFARFFVEDFFEVGCFGRRDLLSGNKFALMEHTCEWLIKGAA